MRDFQGDDDRLLIRLSFGWGACTFFPVGIAYSCMLLMLVALLVRGGLRERLGRLNEPRLLWPAAAVLGWTVVALAAGPWFEDSGARIFHLIRVMLLLAMGAMLTPAEARAAIAGFLLAALAAAMVVAVHHLWGLPDWAIWSSLIRSRNNFSSGNMIMMALAAALLFYLGLRNDPAWLGRWIAWAGALALAATVIAHSLSRNAQVLLPALMALALVVHYRAWRAIIMALIGVVVLAGLAWQLSPATQKRFHAVVQEARLLQSAGDYTTGVGERYLMAREGWRGMTTHPLTGTGVGSWLPRWKVVAEKTGQHLPPDRLERHMEINNPHNEYMLAGMETGIPGLLALVWLLVALLWLSWAQRSLAGDIAFLMAAGLALCCLINAPLRDAAMGMTLLWLLGGSIAHMRARS